MTAKEFLESEGYTFSDSIFNDAEITVEELAELLDKYLLINTGSIHE